MTLETDATMDFDAEAAVEAETLLATTEDNEHDDFEPAFCMSTKSRTLAGSIAEQLHVLMHHFHETTLARAKTGTKRTGKPEGPLRLAWTLDCTAAKVHQLAAQHIATAILSSQDSQLIYTIYASEFWQKYPLLHPAAASSHTAALVPQRMIYSNNTSHPTRPPNPRPGTRIYTRPIPSLGTTLSLVALDVNIHLNDFHAWHNSDRVNAFWGERGTLDAHQSYLARQAADPHVLPVIGYFGSEAFAYFEVYWAKEDAIGTHAGASDWDAGFHALVGNEAHRGPDKVRVWISSLTHYLFLRDQRTQRVMLEPRVDNAKFIHYLTKQGYMVEKEFNFPHKRAALVSISREKFFEVQGVET